MVNIDNNSIQNATLKDGRLVLGKSDLSNSSIYINDSGTQGSFVAGSIAKGYINNGGTNNHISVENAFGAMATGEITNSSYSYISAKADGATALGVILNGDSGSISASGKASYAHGCIDRYGSIDAYGAGAVAHGYTTGENSYIKAGIGAVAYGQTAAKNSSIKAAGAGSLAHGYTYGERSYILAYAAGDAHGSVTGTNSYVFATTGAVAHGYVEGEDSAIAASGSGAYAGGFAQNGIIKANSNGAHAEGLNTNALNTAAHAEGEGYYEIGYKCSGGLRLAEDETITRYSLTLFETSNFSIEIENGYCIYIYQHISTYDTGEFIAKISFVEDMGAGKYRFTLNTSELAERLSDLIYDPTLLCITPNLPTQYKKYINMNGATGFASHTEGSKTRATATASHAGGIGTYANYEAMTAIGKYNDYDYAEYGENVLFAIGGGTDTTHRKNILTANQDNNVYLNNNKLVFSTYKVENTSLNYIQYNNNKLELCSKDIFSVSSSSNITISSSNNITLISNSGKILPNNLYVTNEARAKVNDLSNVLLGVPIGTVMLWNGKSSTAPDGWLFCDDSSFPAIIGTISKYAPNTVIQSKAISEKIMQLFIKTINVEHYIPDTALKPVLVAVSPRHGKFDLIKDCSISIDTGTIPYTYTFTNISTTRNSLEAKVLYVNKMRSPTYVNGESHLAPIIEVQYYTIPKISNVSSDSGLTSLKYIIKYE